jgi:hypothetical protein
MYLASIELMKLNNAHKFFLKKKKKKKRKKEKEEEEDIGAEGAPLVVLYL